MLHGNKSSICVKLYRYLTCSKQKFDNNNNVIVVKKRKVIVAKPKINLEELFSPK
jgi:hypothetical protein